MNSGRFLSVRKSLVTAWLALCTSPLANTAPGVKEVNCSAGKNITEVLAKAEPGDAIQITGTCTERLAVTTDRVTLDGQGSATLNGGGSTGGSFAGVIEIQGARGVVIKGLTVQNGPNGIAASGGAAFYVRDSVFQNHAGSGMLIIGGSTGELTNCAMLKNGAGMNVLTGSTVVLKGAISANGNAGNGISIGGGSMLEIRGAVVQANNNMVVGVSISGAQGAIWAFSEAQGSSITATGNAFAGLGIAEANFQSGGGSGPNTINVSNNGAFGFFLPIGGVIDSPFGSIQFMASGNPVGLYLGIGSRALIHGGVTMQHNKTGVLADGADTLNVNASPAPIPPAPSTINGNDTDVDLRFGSRAIFGNAVTIGTIKCDKTVLSRGSTVCP
jgi:Right handed beta helix region